MIHRVKTGESSGIESVMKSKDPTGCFSSTLMYEMVYLISTLDSSPGSEIISV